MIKYLCKIFCKPFAKIKYKKIKYKDFFEFLEIRIKQVKEYSNPRIEKDVLDLPFLLLPLIDLIGNVLYKKNLRKFFSMLNCPKFISDMIVESIRNGYMHTSNTSVLYYKNRSISIVEHFSRCDVEIPLSEYNNYFYEFNENTLSIYWDNFLLILENLINYERGRVNLDEEVDFPVGKILNKEIQISSVKNLKYTIK